MSYGVHHQAPSPTPLELPPLPGDGPTVDAGRFRAAGTGLWLAISYGFLALLIVGSFGFLLLGLLFGYLADLMLSRRTMARLRGSAVQVGQNQLSAIDACARQFAARLKLEGAPTVLVAESSMLNAVAMRIGKRRCVMLLDDVVWGAIDYQIPDALRFVIAHELAHHALGHAGVLRSYLRLVLPPLSRLDELSADTVALQLVERARPPRKV
jgi:Zn-dependent protease with chaperone function